MSFIPDLILHVITGYKGQNRAFQSRKCRQTVVQAVQHMIITVLMAIKQTAAQHNFHGDCGGPNPQN